MALFKVIVAYVTNIILSFWFFASTCFSGWLMAHPLYNDFDWQISFYCFLVVFVMHFLFLLYCTIILLKKKMKRDADHAI